MVARLHIGDFRPDLLNHTRRLVSELYVLLLSRFPTSGETLRALTYLEGEERSLRDGAVDLVWALLNTKEFLYRH